MSGPKVSCGGVEIDFGYFTAAWEDTDEGKTGVSMKSNFLHPGHGAIFFFPDPHAKTIREALGSQVSKTPPANTKELPLR